MKHLFFILICSSLMCAATMTVQAQEKNNADSVFREIAENSKEDKDIRRFALTRITNQNVFSEIAANSKEDKEIRRFALTRITDQNVFREIALNDKEDKEIRRFALTCIK